MKRRRVTHRRGSRQDRLVYIVLLLCVMVMVSVFTGGPLRAQSTDSRDFHIRSQPLDAALKAFAITSDLLLSYEADMTTGRQSASVSGHYTSEEALKLLLNGTGLGYRFLNEKTVTVLPIESSTVPAVTPLQHQPSTIAAKPTAENPSPEEQKPIKVTEVVVKDILLQDTAMIGNLPPEYPGEQVAEGGRVGLQGNRSFMNTPFSITSYTQKTIQDRQARSIADVLDNDPSVRSVFPRGSGIDQFFFRGFIVPSQDVSFDGLYGIAPSSSNVMTMESIERVEVLKGPSSFLNGMPPSGNVAGSINLVPKRATDEPITQLTGTYFSNSQFGGHVDIGRRFGEGNRFGVRVNGVYRNGNTSIQPNAQETGAIALGFDYRGDRYRLSLDLGYQQQNSRGIMRGVGVPINLPIPGAPDMTHGYAQPWTFAKQSDPYGAVRGEFDVTRNVMVHAAFGMSKNYNRFLTGFPTVTSAQGNISTPIFIRPILKITSPQRRACGPRL